MELVVEVDGYVCEVVYVFVYVEFFLVDEVVLEVVLGVFIFFLFYVVKDGYYIVVFFVVNLFRVLWWVN